jgi:hypothetical protein
MTDIYLLSDMLALNATLARALEHLADPASAPLHARLLLEPLLAAGLAVADGVKEARPLENSRLWALTRAGRREERRKDRWRAAGRIFLLALALDGAFQLIELRALFPREAAMAALLLAALPYLAVRGLTRRIAVHSRPVSRPRPAVDAS